MRSNCQALDNDKTFLCAHTCKCGTQKSSATGNSELTAETIRSLSIISWQTLKETSKLADKHELGDIIVSERYSWLGDILHRLI